MNRISTFSCLVGVYVQRVVVKSNPLCMRFENKRLNCATMFVCHVLTFDLFFTMGEFVMYLCACFIFVCCCGQYCWFPIIY